MKLGRLVGDREFYKRTLLVAVPIMIQNGITNFVNLLDNIMVGRIGTEQMSGVAITNQLMFVFHLSIFGAISGAGIFSAQFYGKGDHEGIRYTMRFKWIISMVILAIALGLFFVFGEQLIMCYLQGSSDVGDVAQTLQYGQQYLALIMLEMLPFAVVQIYASTMRETGETVLPMMAGIVAVVVNLLGNYLLIFGKFGCPMLGVRGAAIATVLSRLVECAIVILWAHTNKKKAPYAAGLYRGFRIPRQLTLQILVKGTPLLINEFLWAGGMAVLAQCYSLRGLSVVAALNISNTISNVFNVVFIAMGSAVSIIVGQLLGAGRIEEAKDTDAKLIVFSVELCVVVGALMALVSPLFPKIYDTQDVVRHLATELICVTALCMPIQAFVNSAYFTLRSGGKTIITFIFDSAFVWTVSIPLAYCLSRFTALPIVPLYLACQLIDIIKCIIGFIFVKKGIWLHNIVDSP